MNDQEKSARALRNCKLFGSLEAEQLEALVRIARFQAAAAERRQRLADRILGESPVPVGASLHRWLPMPAGVSSAGFRITEQPAASGAPSLRAGLPAQVRC